MIQAGYESRDHQRKKQLHNPLMRVNEATLDSLNTSFFFKT